MNYDAIGSASNYKTKREIVNFTVRYIFAACEMPALFTWIAGSTRVTVFERLYKDLTECHRERQSQLAGVTSH
jgi:hypothetical protein